MSNVAALGPLVFSREARFGLQVLLLVPVGAILKFKLSVLHLNFTNTSNLDPEKVVGWLKPP